MNKSFKRGFLVGLVILISVIAAFAVISGNKVEVKASEPNPTPAQTEVKNIDNTPVVEDTDEEVKVDTKSVIGNVVTKKDEVKTTHNSSEESETVIGGSNESNNTFEHTEEKPSVATDTIEETEEEEEVAPATTPATESTTVVEEDVPAVEVPATEAPVEVDPVTPVTGDVLIFD